FSLDWSSDVCSSDLAAAAEPRTSAGGGGRPGLPGAVRPGHGWPARGAGRRGHMVAVAHRPWPCTPDRVLLGRVRAASVAADLRQIGRASWRERTPML